MGKKRTDKDRARLDALIEEATVDCYNEAEAHMGLVASVAGGVVCPFKAKVMGEDVEVVELRGGSHVRVEDGNFLMGEDVEVVELREREDFHGLGVDAVCRYKGKDYRIDIFSLEWPKKKPQGYEWVEAYRAWLGGEG